MSLSATPSPRRDARLLLFYFILAILFTYPLVLHLDTHQPGHGGDDPAQTWSIWWVRYALFAIGANPLTTDYLFYPIGINLVAYTPVFLNGILSIPLQFAVGVVPAQNLLVYFALVAGGYGTYLFTRAVLVHLRQGSASQIDRAAALAGAFYALGAWHLNYAVAGHFMLLNNHWIPFYALYLIRWRKHGWKNGARAGFFLVLNAWTELTFVVFLAILTTLYFGFRISDFGRRITNYEHLPLRAVQGLRITNFISLTLVSAIGISPLALNIGQDLQRYGYYLAQGVGRVQVFSAEPISFFVPSSAHPTWGAWASALTNANTSYAFIGYATLLLALVGLFTHRAARVWGALALCFALLMLGATLIIGEQSTGIPLPFAILRGIPFVNANRYPVRFNVMLALALAPLIALGAARLLRARPAALVALAALLAFEQLVLPLPLTDMRVPAIFQTLRDEPGDFAILELPLGWRGSISMLGKLDDRAQFFQTVHHKRLLGGITSRTPRFKMQYFVEAPVVAALIALAEGREVDVVRRARDRELAPAVLRFFNVRYVDVNRALTDAAVLEYARDVFPMTEIYRDEARILYRIAPPEPENRVEPSAEIARLNFDDRWGRPQFDAAGGYRWATQSDAALWLTLARAEAVITFRLLAPRAAQKISVRVNGQDLAELVVTNAWRDYLVRVPAGSARAGLNEFVFSTETAPIGATRQADYTIGATGVVAPVDISAVGAGFEAGRFGEIFIAGKNVIENKRGYHLAAINPQSGAVERVAVFDTFDDAAESARLAQFVAELPRGAIVAGIAVDDVSRNLQARAVDALRALGVEGDLRFQFRAGHAFIGVKGAQAGQALEHVDGRLPANVWAGKNVASGRVAFALGRIEIAQ